MSEKPTDSAVEQSPPGRRPDNDEVRSEAARVARVAGLRDFATPSLESVERRRLQLWLMTLFLLLAVVVALVVISSWSGLPVARWMTPRALQVGLLGLVALFSAYAVEKELQLRRLTVLLVRERVLTAALTNRMKELAKLLDAGKAMNLVLDLDEVLATILESATELLDARNGTVLLLHGEGELRTAGCVGHGVDRGARHRLGEGVPGQVAARREPMLVHEGDGGDGTSRMSVPLVHRDRLLGVLTVTAAGGRRFTEYDLRALGLFGEHAAGAIANANLYEAQRLLASQNMYLALHDSLTNLPNRALFLDRLEHALFRRRPEDTRAAMLYIDLDDFKTVNDVLGHGGGDAALAAFAERLRSSVRAGDTVARLGGDEFGVLLEDLHGVDEAVSSAERLRATLAEPFRVGGENVVLQASIGVAVEAADARGAEDLLNKADAAMYTAKERGDGNVVLFRVAMESGELTRELERQLAGALGAGQLEVQYQPVVALATSEVLGVEAMLSWRHPERGLLPGSFFLPLAERIGTIAELERWLLHRAVRAVAALGAGIRLHVDVSAVRLREGTLAAEVGACLQAEGFEPSRLVLEVPEAAWVHDPATVREQLEQLGRLGVRVALDDFGSGYSSFGHLQRVAVDALKIDRIFVEGLETDPGAVNLVQAVVRMGQSMGLDVIAEGVERPGHAESLLELGCRMGQGALFGGPVPADGLADAVVERIKA